MTALLSRIRQGQYDSEKVLLRFRENTLERERLDVLDTVKVQILWRRSELSSIDVIL